jgi:hypothetical protein
MFYGRNSLKRDVISEEILHSHTSHKTVPFIVATVRTANQSQPLTLLNELSQLGPKSMYNYQVILCMSLCFLSNTTIHQITHTLLCMHTLHSMDPKLVEVTVGCGTSHTTIRTHIQYSQSITEIIHRCKSDAVNLHYVYNRNSSTE